MWARTGSDDPTGVRDASSSRRMSRIRSRMRSRLTRPSDRAKGPPGQVWTPRPKAICAACVRPVHLEFRRIRETPGIAVGGTVEQHDRRARGNVHSADRGGAAGQAEVGLHRALYPQGLLDEAGNELVASPKLVLELRVFGRGTSTRRRADVLSSPGRPRTGTWRSAPRRSRRAWSRPDTWPGPGRSARPWRGWRRRSSM